jgi:flagellar biosynthesis protein FlhG
MDKKQFTILASSQKGGVGKTVIAINVTAALRTAGYEVLLIDTDVANPSVEPMLGMPDSSAGYAEVLMNKANIEDSLIIYEPTGFYVLPAGGKGVAITETAEQQNKFYEKLTKLEFDFVVVDTPPGMATDGGLKSFDEALIVTTPEEASVFGAQRLSKLYNSNHLNHKLVINRVKQDKFLLDEDKIEKIYGDIAYAMLPEDEIVVEGESKHIPAYLIDRKALFSVSIDDLCRSYMLKAGEPAEESRPKRGAFSNIKRFFGMH